LNCGDDSVIGKNEVIYEKEPENYQYHEFGVYGGECTCPDGNKYFSSVAEGSGCDSIDAAKNCVNGNFTNCHEKRGFWSRQKVICARSNTQHWSNATGNYFQTNDLKEMRCTNRNCKKWHWEALKSMQNAFEPYQYGGSYGGICLCPNGQKYYTSDYNGCRNLNCQNGSKKSCHYQEDKSRYSYHGVKCAPPPLTLPIEIDKITPNFCSECWGIEDMRDFYTWP